MNRYVVNLAPMPGVFPDYPAPVVRIAGAARELVLMRWGMPPPPRTGGAPVTNIRNTSSPHWRGWLKPESRCLVSFNRFSEYAPEPLRTIHIEINRLLQELASSRVIEFVQVRPLFGRLRILR
jgi:putative SOS response-associated peptidase YedK